MNNTKLILSLGISFSFLVINQATFAATSGYAPWLTQIGINDAVMSAANWGRGQTLGVVDTGIVSNNSMFAAGQVSNTLSSCAAVSFKCTNGVLDDNSHGTAVASIAAANAGSPFSFMTTGANPYVVYKNMAVSVAPNANLVAEKVLSSAGSGYSTDVANGIIKAVDAGASVINLSLTYGNTPDLVKAVNYAASKGAFVVWAGGNDGVNLLNGAASTGLTADAVNHLVLVGSVNNKNVVSSFSNKPGAGVLNATDKTVKTYASRWVVAPGESIFAPVVTSNSYGLWSGTSMSTPLVSGSLILLESAWPILKTKGSAANLLLSTTTDLGATGVDTTYGNGLVNLSKAFQPYGTLSVAQANGNLVPVTSLTGKLITNGALGALPAVQAKLSNYIVFDTYSRNFTMNLSGLIKTTPTAASLNPLPTNLNTGPVTMKYNGIGELTMMQYSEPLDTELLALTDKEKTALYENRPMYAMFNSQSGSTLAMGFAYPSSFSYSRAMYGSDELARLAGELNLTSLSSLAEGGNFLAYGTKFSDDDRVAFAWSQSPMIDASSAFNRTASNVNLGWSHRVNNHLMVGMNYSLLDENAGLLGASYSGTTLGFGDSNTTDNVGFSLAYGFNERSAMMLETGFANTKGQNGTGLIGKTTDIQSQSLGITFMSKALFDKTDRFSLSIKQPLRVSAGRASVLNTSVDADGLPVFNYDNVSLVPDGREIDFKATYSAFLSANQSINLSAMYRNEVSNIRGNDDVSANVMWALKF